MKTCTYIPSYRILLIALCCCLLQLTANSQDYPPTFKIEVPPQALPEELITALHQDQEGYIWIGTQIGLVRYDGYEVKRYFPVSQDSTAGEQRFRVITMKEDENGDIWMGSSLAGFLKYERATDQLHSFQVRPPVSENMLNNEFFVGLVDRKGGIWTVSRSDTLLYRTDPLTKESIPILHKPAEANLPTFSHVYFRQGLIGNTALCEDRRGSIWIGSHGKGLARYDVEIGRFQHFVHDPDDPNSLPSNTVSTILEDETGRLWIGTYQGLAEYKQESQQFLRYPVPFPDPSDASNDTLLMISPDSKGLLWISYAGQVLSFDGRSEVFKKGFPGRYMLPISLWGENEQGDLWFPSSVGLIRYNRHQEQVTYRAWPYRELGRGISLLGFVDPSGQVWNGYGRLGLMKEDALGSKFRAYRHDPAEIKTIASDRVSTIYEDRWGTIWLGGVDGGLCFYQPETHQIRRLIAPSFPNYVRVRKILEDKHGYFWIATNNGLYKTSAQALHEATINLAQRFGKASSSTQEFSYMGPEKAIDGRFDNRWSTAFYDPQWLTIDLGEARSLGRLIITWDNSAAKNFQIQLSNDNSNWLTVETLVKTNTNTDDVTLNSQSRYLRLFGTERRTPYSYSLIETEIYSPPPEFTHYTHSQGDPNSLPNNNILDLVLDYNDAVWVSTVNGIAKYNPTTDSFSSFYPEPGDNRKNENTILKIVPDSTAQSLWCFPYIYNTVGLYQFFPQTNTFRQYQHQESDSTSLGLNVVSRALIDRQDRVWFGTDGRGVSLYHRDRDAFSTYGIDAEKGFTSIMKIHEDRKGRFWLGTYHSGLYRLDRETGDTKIYRESDGLLSGLVRDILEDEAGKLWLLTDLGLSHFDPETEQFESFFTEDGLSTNNFRLGPGGLVGSTGHLYLAGEEGLTVFHPKDVVKDSVPPKVLITGLEISYQEVKVGEKDSPLEKQISQTTQVRLRNDQDLLTFYYTALHYGLPERNQYAVMLEGRDPDWIHVGTERKQTYSGLRPGSYTFRVKAANADGIWNETGVSLNVVILPPWWASTWAILTYIILGAAGIWYYIQWRIRKQKQALKREKEINERLLTVDKLKDQFLANTSHELRTPLNGIIGLAESLKDGVAGSVTQKARDNLNMIISSGKRLGNLVNDILDFSKLKNHDLALKTLPMDLHSAVDIVLALSQPLTLGKDLELINAVPRDLPLVDADENRIQQILHNLVGNAIKFTEKGAVTVGTVLQNGGKDSAMVTVFVKDTGVGISPDKQERIFQSFEQADGSTAHEFGGTGLGLTVSRQLVELHGGKIWVDSPTGQRSGTEKGEQGSTFSFTLPISDQQRQELRKEDYIIGELMVHKTTAAGEKGTIDEHFAAKTPPASAGGSIKVLIVDDEPINRQVLENHLSMEGYKVTHATDGIEALEILERGEHFDLILLDIMMPKMSGYEVCEKLRTIYLPSELPVVMLTAKNRVNDLVQGFKTGANDYLTKPFSKDELLSRIKTHLNLHRIHEATGRFVPAAFLKSIGRSGITEVQLGDQVAREVTILFSDIRGYMQLSENMSPEENFRFVRAYCERIGPIVQANQGFVHQYLGDGIMAIFQSKPSDALWAAIQMQQKIRIYNKERIAVKRKPLHVGIGLHTGQLIMGIIGDENRRDAATISDSVNIASRMEGLTKFFGANILLSEISMKQIEAEGNTNFYFRHLGLVQVKGKQAPIGLYECFSGDPQEIIQAKLQSLPLFRLGLHHYLSKEFPEASAAFNQVLAMNAKDRVAQFFLKKAGRYIVDGVDEDWMGVEQMDSK